MTRARVAESTRAYRAKHLHASSGRPSARRDRPTADTPSERPPGGNSPSPKSDTPTHCACVVTSPQRVRRHTRAEDVEQGSLVDQAEARRRSRRRTERPQPPPESDSATAGARPAASRPDPAAPHPAHDPSQRSQRTHPKEPDNAFLRGWYRHHERTDYSGGAKGFGAGRVFSRPKTRRHPAARPHPRGVQRHDGKPHRATAPPPFNPAATRTHKTTRPSQDPDRIEQPSPQPARATTMSSNTTSHRVEQHQSEARTPQASGSTSHPHAPRRGVQRHAGKPHRATAPSRSTPRPPAPATRQLAQRRIPDRVEQSSPNPQNEPTATAPSRRHDPHVYSDGSPSDAFRHDDNRPAGQARSDPKTDTNTRTATRRPEPHLVAAEDCGGGGLRPGHPRDRPGRSRGSQAMSPHRRSPWLLET